ncbi:phosphoribosylanthranilate isomerase [bacterium]|nr:phosphoribosylanthranilate isomerase [bacterium]
MRRIIQIAGILDLKEAQMVIQAGADWLGFPLRLTHHQDDISDQQASQIVQSLPPEQAAVLITYLRKATDVIDLSRKLGCKKVQLHANLSVREVRKLRLEAPELFLIKSLIVREENYAELQDAAHRWSPHVDAFITDTFDAESGACGATGKTHDWHVSRMLVERSPKPVILAGGLNPENVGKAIETVKPTGVDAHTGLEGPDGRKREELVRAFISEARSAFAKLKLDAI